MRRLLRLVGTFDSTAELHGHLVRSGARRERRRGGARRPDLRRGARQRDRRGRRGPAGQRGGDAQAVARNRAAALRPDEFAARGDPPLWLDGAPHALGGAALLRSAQDPHLPRTDSRCLPTDYREKVREVLHSFADAGRGVRPSKDADPIAEYGAAAQRLLTAGLENEARTFDDTRSRITSRSSRPAACRVPACRATTARSSISWRAFPRQLPSGRGVGARRAHHRRRGERFRSRARTIMEPAGARSAMPAPTKKASRHCRR